MVVSIYLRPAVSQTFDVADYVAFIGFEKIVRSVEVVSYGEYVISEGSLGNVLSLKEVGVCGNALYRNVVEKSVASSRIGINEIVDVFAYL